MKEPKILPDGTDIHNIRKLSSRVLSLFLYWHRENDELRMVAEDEMELRTMLSRDYFENNTRYEVEGLRAGDGNTEFSDGYDIDDDFFW